MDRKYRGKMINQTKRDESYCKKLRRDKQILVEIKKQKQEIDISERGLSTIISTTVGNGRVVIAGITGEKKEKLEGHTEKIIEFKEGITVRYLNSDRKHAWVLERQECMTIDWQNSGIQIEKIIIKKSNKTYKWWKARWGK